MALQPRCAADGVTLAYQAKTRKGWVAGETGRLAQIRPGRYGRGVQYCSAMIASTGSPSSASRGSTAAIMAGLPHR